MIFNIVFMILEMGIGRIGPTRESSSACFSICSAESPVQRNVLLISWQHRAYKSLGESRVATFTFGTLEPVISKQYCLLGSLLVRALFLVSLSANELVPSFLYEAESNYTPALMISAKIITEIVFHSA